MDMGKNMKKNINKEIEQLQVQLAGCSVAALGGIKKDSLVAQGDYGWSSSYQDVVNLRVEYEVLLEKIKQLEKM